MLDPPLWQVIQFCVEESMFAIGGCGPRSNRGPAAELCGIWHDRHAFCATVE